ncbi:unnamed protein product [Mortierella alpina]
MMAVQTSQQQSLQADDRSHTHQDFEVEAPCHRTRAEVVDGEAGKVLAERTEHTPSPHSSTGGDSFRDNNQSLTTLDTQQRPRPQIAQQHANYGVLSTHDSDKCSGTRCRPAAPCCPIPVLPLQPAISEQQEQEHQQGQSDTQEQRAPRCPESQRQQQPAHGPSGGLLDRFPLAESQSSQGQLATLPQLQFQQVPMPSPSPSIIMPQRGEHASDDDHKGQPHQAAGEPDQGCCCDTEFVESTSSSPRRLSSSNSSSNRNSSSISNSSSNSNSSHSGPNSVPRCPPARLRQKSVPNLSLGSTLTPRPLLSRSPSLSLLPFGGTLTSPNHGETTTSTTLSCAYPQPFLSVPSASPSENRLSPVGRISNTSTTSLLRNLDSLSAQISSDSDMTRQRSMSTSSLGTLAKSPSSLTASLSASVALYDSHQPPKTLQDILLLAQSHYISHRYVPALTLYRLAAEKHHSLPACCSLYALYTSTVKAPGLVRSDTKAAEVLIHALRIWTARRWSGSFSSLDGSTQGSMRSKTRDDHAELEEYFAHPRSASSSSQSKAGQRPSSLAKNNHQTGASTIPISSRRDFASRTIVVTESVESEYRRPELRHLVDGSESKDSAPGNESGSDDDEDDDDDDDESEDDDCDSECEACQDCDGGCEHCMDSEEEEEEDEEQAKEEAARRIGLATMEIEDIVQKLCSMIQKGVLGLDEAVVVEAISMVRKIERGLSKDGEAWQAQMAKSKSLFESSLSGGKIEGGEGGSSSSSGSSRTGGTAAAAGLLLTQSIDLSFLNLTPESTSPLSQVRAVDLSSRKRAKVAAAASTSASTSLSKSYPVNAAISRLSIGEQEAEQAICRAMRIRIMFTLGWVHQQRGEYHWGAQAYGVCSEVIPPTGKRLLISLQQQATVQKWTCLAFEKKAQEQQAQAEEDERQRVIAVEQQQQKPDRIPSPPGSTQQQQETQHRQPRKLTASPSYTSSEVSTAAHHHADISSPSSYSSSESAAVSIRGGHAGTTISSLSAAMWSSGLFKSSTSTTTLSETSIPTASNAASTTTATTLGAMVGKAASPAGTLSSVQSDPTSKSSASRQLHRSKSVSLGLKINTLNNKEPSQQETKEKEPQHHHQHHHPRAQHRSKGQGHHPHAQGGSAAAAVAAAVLTMTMSDHQKKVVKCGHCGQKRILMPLCVCKRVRYCNRECRIADLEAHRKTGCHAALMSTSIGSTSSSEGASAATAAAVAVTATAAAGPGVSM